jgi:hypothetical protein
MMTKKRMKKRGDPSGIIQNAPQGVVDAIAIARAKEEQEGPPDMISGSVGSWGMEQG